MRAVSLENLGNYRECLKSYLKAYELDTAHPTELLLSVIGAVGCICQMSETEELTLSDQGKDCDLTSQGGTGVGRQEKWDSQGGGNWEK